MGSTYTKNIDTDALNSSNEQLILNLVSNVYSSTPSYWIGEDDTSLSGIDSFLVDMRSCISDSQEAVVNLNDFLHDVAAEFSRVDGVLASEISNINLSQIPEASSGTKASSKTVNSLRD